MSVALTNFQNSFPAAYSANGKNTSRRIGQEKTGRFEMPFSGAEPSPSSFVGKVYTREELLQSVEEKVRQNQGKKMLLADLVRSAHPEGNRAKFRFAGEAKIYTLDEYIQELDKRSKQH